MRAHDAFVVGHENGGNRIDVVTPVKITVRSELDVVNDDGARLEGTSLCHDIGAGLTRRRREHDDEPVDVGSFEIRAVDLCGNRESGLCRCSRAPTSADESGRDSADHHDESKNGVLHQGVPTPLGTGSAGTMSRPPTPVDLGMRRTTNSGWVDSTSNWSSATPFGIATSTTAPAGTETD